MPHSHSLSQQLFHDAIFAITEPCAPVEPHDGLEDLDADGIIALSRALAVEDDEDLTEQDLDQRCQDVSRDDLVAILELNNHPKAVHGWYIFGAFDPECGYAARAEEALVILNHPQPAEYIKTKMTPLDNPDYLWSQRDPETFVEVQKDTLEYVQKHLAKKIKIKATAMYSTTPTLKNIVTAIKASPNQWMTRSEIKEHFAGVDPAVVNKNLKQGVDSGRLIKSGDTYRSSK